MKIDLSEIEKIKEEQRKILKNLYEEKAKDLVGKFYNYEYINQWDEHQHDYLYIYGNIGNNLHGIEFNMLNLEIIKAGRSIDYFDKWTEVKPEELMDIKFKLIEFFHLKDIFGGYL